MSKYENLLSQFQDKLKFAPDFKKTVKFVVADDDNHTITIKCDERPATITHGDEESDVTLIANQDIFEGIMNGSRDPNMAFMMRKLKIKGNMGVAMRLNAVLED